MRQQGIQDDSWTETEAMRLVQRLDVAEGLQGCRALLERTVEDQVIPRLIRARRPDRASSVGHIPPVVASHHVATLVTTALIGSQQDVDDYLGALRAGGVTPERLLLDLISPAARRFGEMWEDDTSSFSEVTLATLRLCRAVHALGAQAPRPNPLPAGAPRALLAQVPGEQHGLGLIILAQFFRRAAWDVQQEAPRSSAELVSLLHRQAFDLVGLSVSGDDRLDGLAATIAAIRQSSRNPAILVMVGGPPFTAQPLLADMVGADATAADGAQAVRLAHLLLSRQVCAA